MVSPVDDDPDVRQAVRDFLPLAALIRERRAELARLGDQAGQAVRDHIRSLMGDIQTRAARIGVDFDVLMVLLNAELDARWRGGGRAPTRPGPQTLLTAVVNAEAAVDQARQELLRAQARLRGAENNLRAAEAAYRSYGGGKLVEAA